MKASGRLSLRIAPEDLEAIQAAANLYSGGNVTALMVEASRQAARKILASLGEKPVRTTLAKGETDGTR